MEGLFADGRMIDIAIMVLLGEMLLLASALAHGPGLWLHTQHGAR